MGPCALVARRHHVGMPGKDDVRGTVADTGIEIVDIGGTGFAEGDPVDLEARALQDILKDAERAGIGGGHRRAAEEIAGDGKGINHAPA